MSELSPRLGLPYIQAAQAQKHVTHNEALRRLDVMVQATVLNRNLTQPPVAPADGDCHIVATGAGGQWAGQDGALAQWDGVGWLFVPAQTGLQAYVEAEAARVVYTGTGWDSTDADPETLGINTSADTTNRLAVSAPSTLLTNDGAGHQLKINKAATADTASLLFQTNWSGRAEIGTTGNDAFTIKLSADGTTWTEALNFDPSTGHASGAAVQTSALDTTPGRLMRADWGYGPGNILGTATQTAGQPTGAVIERGANANGEYVRFADGTQICTRIATVDVEGAWYQTFPFPAAFAASAQPFVSWSHLDYVPNAGLSFTNMQAVCGWSGPYQYWSTTMTAPSTASNPVGRKHGLCLTAIGRWF